MTELEAALAHANNYRADAHHRALAVEISRLRLELERQSTMDMQMTVLMRERDAAKAEVERAREVGFRVGFSSAADYYTEPTEDEAWADYQLERVEAKA